jgi:hypothetical protein
VLRAVVRSHRGTALIVVNRRNLVAANLGSAKREADRFAWAWLMTKPNGIEIVDAGGTVLARRRFACGAVPRPWEK